MANCNKLVGHTWEDPLVYMVSPMASTCDPYATKCTKAEPKILQVKRGQKWRNAPDSARKRRNWVRFGCWRGWQRLEADSPTKEMHDHGLVVAATAEELASVSGETLLARAPPKGGPVSPLLAKNVPPARFPNARTLPDSSPSTL